MTTLTFDEVSVALRRRPVLERVSFELSPGKLVTLLGPNGAGKTTLLRCALGLVRPRAGRVLLGGIPVHDLAPRARAAQIAWLPQQHWPSEPLTVLEVVQTARYRFHEGHAAAERAAHAALERVGARALAHSIVTELSGGERQRVALATLLAQEARLILLDEPANHLDPAQQLEIHRFVRELVNNGLGVLLVSHDVNLPAVLDLELGGTVVGLAAGRVAFVESAASQTLPERLSALYGVAFRVLEQDGHRVLLAIAAGERT